MGRQKRRQRFRLRVEYAQTSDFPCGHPEADADVIVIDRQSRHGLAAGMGLCRCAGPGEHKQGRQTDAATLQGPDHLKDSG